MSSIKKYDIIASQDSMTYFFVSEGQQNILKRVDFEATHIANLFNLAL